MQIERVMQLMELERECVLRQDGTDCPRNVDPTRGCYGCPLLVHDGKEIVEAYDRVITMLRCVSDAKDWFSEITKGDKT